ncbi:ATP-binding protein [Mycobacteroides abscessus]|uniref:ATP-binding protein n=1 Tax=Mycobacteroides abscessus TaxID=36809 RepID=UPI0005DF5BB5|nr:ATP-binding protein [Mycobacteroides abscessus]CPW02514.1 cell division control protein 6 [Mycobacteroides abscessus]
MDDKIDRLIKLQKIFTPSAPVARKDRFAGRLDQVIDVITALEQPGMHVVLYGERGVGKTSLANVLSQFLEPLGAARPVVRINCGTEDNFYSIWKRVFREVDVDLAEVIGPGTCDPDTIRHYLQQRSTPYVFILDEYDRIESPEGLSQMADTIKALSDHDVGAKLVIVGVADSLDQLIGEHESVQRALREVPVPRMGDSEQAQIVENGLATVSLRASVAAKLALGRLAEGLPHYVHLLALEAATAAVSDDRDLVDMTDVKRSIRRAVDKHTLMKEYLTAIQSSRDSLYEAVLLACALAEKDRLGYFAPPAVRQPLTDVMNREYDIPAFSRHLKQFTDYDRGSVLKREGVERRYRYRFRNPLMQPFTVLHAINEGRLPDSYHRQILGGA